MKNFLFTIQSYINQFLFGRKCAGCGTPGESICKSCLGNISLSSATEHPGIYGIYDYGNPIVSHAIWNLKYKHNGQEAKLLSQKAEVLIAEIISEQLQSERPEKIVFVPIPQYRKKTEKRGFNQSALVAKWFSRDFPLSSVQNILEKYRDTLPQSHISSREGRVKNIHDTMRVSGKIDPKQIYVIVDDVTTTGATFLEAMRALKSAGARNIICIALAHGYKRR
jgi:ComF family protein